MKNQIDFSRAIEITKELDEIKKLAKEALQTYLCANFHSNYDIQDISFNEDDVSVSVGGSVCGSWDDDGFRVSYDYFDNPVAYISREQAEREEKKKISEEKSRQEDENERRKLWEKLCSEFGSK